MEPRPPRPKPAVTLVTVPRKGPATAFKGAQVKPPMPFPCGKTVQGESTCPAARWTRREGRIQGAAQVEDALPAEQRVPPCPAVPPLRCQP